MTCALVSKYLSLSQSTHRDGRTDKSSMILHYSSKSMEDDIILESPMNMAQESIIMTCSIDIYR